MSAKNKAPDVATPSSAYTRMVPRWRLADVLLGGTEALREAGKEFLPQHEKESNLNYGNRLGRCTLLNAFEDTLQTLTGKPFAEDMVYGDDMPEVMLDVCDDIDLQGTALQPFCRAWFREGWAKAFSHVLVDSPIGKQVFDGEGNQRPRTLADDRDEGLRPYWVNVCPENVLAAYDEIVDGRRRLVHVRIYECTVERNGWEEKTIERIKVLEPGTWQTWLFNPGSKKWEVENYGLTDLPEIPLVTFYAGTVIGLHEAKPPLTDLAHLNIAYWQSTSDQRNVLTVARFPILAGSGVDDADKVRVGPNNFLSTADVQGKWYYVEHTGAAIEAGRKDLEDLENQMASYGSEFLRKRQSGGETATARAIDSAESSSYLAATVKSFQDCVEQALRYTAQWMNLEDGGSVQLTGVFEEVPEAAAPELDALSKARATRDISRVAFLNELKRRKVLADDYDAAADEELIAQEKPTDGIDEMFTDKSKKPGEPVVPPGGDD